MNAQLDLSKMYEESLSPEEYLNLSDKERRNIASTKIVPARLGKAGFGRIQVTYKMPTYRYKYER